MRFDGQWLICDDGGVRPAIFGEIQSSNGGWIETPFLVDTAADRTVLTAAILSLLELEPDNLSLGLSGVGGTASAVSITTVIRLTPEKGNKVAFRGEFAAFTEAESLDMSVLGRDILNLFAVIVDKPQDRVCLLGQKHGYVIQQS